MLHNVSFFVFLDWYKTEIFNVNSHASSCFLFLLKKIFFYLNWHFLFICSLLNKKFDHIFQVGKNKHSLWHVLCILSMRRGRGEFCMEQRFCYSLGFCFWRKLYGPAVWNHFLCGLPVILVRELVSGPTGPQSCMRTFHRTWPIIPLFALLTCPGGEQRFTHETRAHIWKRVFCCNGLVFISDGMESKRDWA